MVENMRETIESSVANIASKQGHDLEIYERPDGSRQVAA